MNGILLAILLTAATPPFEVQVLDGRTLTGTLSELTAERLGLDAPGGRVALQTRDVLTVTAKEKPAPVGIAPVVVELVDGSTIRGQQYLAQGSRATISLYGDDSAPVVDAPQEAIRSVQLQPSQTLAKEWDRLTNMPADSDLLVVRKDEGVDYHRGVIHEVTKEEVRFDLDGEVLAVKRSRVFGLVYRHGTVRDLPAAVCRIIDSTGSNWAVQRLSFSEAAEPSIERPLQWMTPSGVSAARTMGKIVQFDFSAGKIIYLSDMQPESASWSPYFSPGRMPAAVEKFYAPRQDRDFDARPLQLGGTVSKKGLALRSRTKVVYRLSNGFRRFLAVTGIGGTARPGSHVRLIVSGDGRELLSETIAGGDLPRPIELDLTGVRQLTILVDFGDIPSRSESLLLCDARLSK
jgi:hypothetical protein